MPNGEELSEREVEILRLVATGVSNKEIAQALSISPNTVKVHLRNIFAKIDVASRTEATLYAIKSGLIAAPVEGSTVPGPAETPGPEPVEVPEAPSAAPRRRLTWLWMGLLLLLAALAIYSAARLTAGLPLLGTAPTATLALSTSQVQRWTDFSAMPDSLNGAAGTAFEQSAYIIGGRDANGASAAVWRYDLMKDAWLACAPKPTPVELAGAALIGESIYIPGGRGADGQATRQLEVYSPRSNQWQKRAELPRALYAYGLASYEGRLYLFGGWDGTQILDTVYIYDPQSDTWSNGQPLPQARAYLAAVAVSGKILVMGGADASGALDANQAYYPQRDLNGEPAWEERSSLPQPRQNFGAALLANGVYLLGGSGNSPSEPASVIYNVDEDSWLVMEPRQGNALTANLGAGLVIIPWQTTIHTFGGTLQGQPSSLHSSYQAIYTSVLPILQK